jgi:hypothetical protein
MPATDIRTKEAIQAALRDFAEKPLANAAIAFFDVLGYHSDRRLKFASVEAFLASSTTITGSAIWLPTARGRFSFNSSPAKRSLPTAPASFNWATGLIKTCGPGCSGTSSPTFFSRSPCPSPSTVALSLQS